MSENGVIAKVISIHVPNVGNDPLRAQPLVVAVISIHVPNVGNDLFYMG